MKLILRFLLITNLIFTPIGLYAAEAEALDVKEGIKDIYTVVGFGLGGAILGLSTLSFVETPSDHYKNILVGGAIGIIMGVGVVAYFQATRSKGFYEEYAKQFQNDREFSTFDRVAWHNHRVKELNANDLNGPAQFAYQFSF